MYMEFLLTGQGQISEQPYLAIWEWASSEPESSTHGVTSKMRLYLFTGWSYCLWSSRFTDNDVDLDLLCGANCAFRC
jgi:hypothetical protein